MSSGVADPKPACGPEHATRSLVQVTAQPDTVPWPLFGGVELSCPPLIMGCDHNLQYHQNGTLVGKEAILCNIKMRSYLNWMDL